MNQEFTLSYQLISSENLLHPSDQQLVSAAKEALIRAYAPYSKFQVGAALELVNGEIIEGNNQENIAYPSGLCAERVALFYAGAQYPNTAIQSLCVAVKGELTSSNNFVSPCGSCRQVMLESESRQEQPIRVLLVQNNGQILILNSCQDLLPFGFMK
ncbi:MAG: hypothetical protein RLZZ65_379 [Bacteroidota bacterium]|jgi:cytidine deaminase